MKPFLAASVWYCQIILQGQKFSSEECLYYHVSTKCHKTIVWVIIRFESNIKTQERRYYNEYWYLQKINGTGSAMMKSSRRMGFCSFKLPVSQPIPPDASDGTVVLILH